MVSDSTPSFSVRSTHWVGSTSYRLSGRYRPGRGEVMSTGPNMNGTYYLPIKQILGRWGRKVSVMRGGCYNSYKTHILTHADTICINLHSSGKCSE